MTKIISRSKNNVSYINDDIFNHIEHYILSQNNGCSIIVPHVCNNIGVFGAGFVNAINKKYPVVKQNYQLLGNNFLKQNLGYTQFVETLSDKQYGHRLIFANMIAQNGTISKSNPRPLNYYALVKCMSSVNQFIKKSFTNDNRIQIHCPKFGSGLAGGNWNFILDLINDIWINIPIFIYSKKS